MEQKIKPGDFVRLTDDPFYNGKIVRIESVDEYGFANFFDGSKAADMEQINMLDINSDLVYYYDNLSELIKDIENKIDIKLYPESEVVYWKRRTEIAEESIIKSKDYIKKVCKESSEDIQKLDTENKKLKEELSRCRAANSDYLTAKTEAENRAKLLEKEVADLKVPESRQNRHLRDELHKVRLECQQAWENANKEMKENKKLRERIKHLEAELEEGGFNDERNFI